MKEWRDVLLCLRQKTAYELRISDWSSDVCSTDLHRAANRIPQQARTYASPLIPHRHCQSCQNHHWQRTLPHPLAHAIPCIQRIDQICRASCRDSLSQSVSISAVAVSFQNNNSLIFVFSRSTPSLRFFINTP